MIDMSQFTTLETVLFWSVVLVAISLLRPYMPPWAVFAFGELFSIYWLARILSDGPNLERVSLLAMGIAAAAYTWWNYLRGHEWYKNPWTTLLILGFTVLSVGCGAPRQVEPTMASRADDDVVCRSEMPTGSHLPQTRCYSREDIERQREAARRARDRQ